MGPADRIPVLWLCGPAGVGKTEVGWEIYSRLDASVDTAYVDIDQLGICYPESSDDPGRHRLKARNLRAVLRSFSTAGARCLLVSGVVDAGHGAPADLIPEAAITVCRLRADADELERRLKKRKGGDSAVVSVRQDAAALDASTFAGAVVDTTGHPVTVVADRVLESTNGWPGSLPSYRLPSDAATAHFEGDALWISGARGVGKSTVGFEVYMEVLRRGETAAYVDVAQLGFCSSAPNDHQLKARSLAAISLNFQALGASRLVLVGQLEDEAAAEIYADAMPVAKITWRRLRASREDLAARILWRGRGGTWAEPGDPLKGRSMSELREVADRSAEEAQALERSGPGVPVDTDGRSAQEAAEEIVAAWTPLFHPDQ